MDGKIEVHSVPKNGTVIMIMLKAKSSLQQEDILSKHLMSQDNTYNKTNANVTITKPKTSKKVLVVEDIPYNQEINKKFLQKCGVTDITIASNGQEAIEIVKRMGDQYFDLILMDIDMPVLDGKIATKIIRNWETENGWKVSNIVFLTAFSESKTKMELLDKKGYYRANGFISKPASLRAIEYALKNKSNSNSNPKAKISTSDAYKNTALVVDDDAFNLTMVSKILKMAGQRVLEVRNGLNALKLYENNWHGIRIILMDCEMPVMDGLEATRRIVEIHKRKTKINAERNDMVIYRLTGHVGREYRQKCLDVGMIDVLEKPITVDKLRNIL